MVREKKYIYILIILSTILLFFNLGSGSLWDNDEALYTEISREISRTGDWLTLHWNFEPWFCHPPLNMWLTALASFIFGWSEFQARFWSVIFSIAIIILVFFIAKRLYSSRVGFQSSLILLVSLQFYIQARMAFLDISFTFFIILSFFLAYIYIEEKKKNSNFSGLKFIIFFWVSCALGTLAKGPFALCLPLAVIFSYAALTKNIRYFLKLALNPAGIALYITIGLSWYIAEYMIFGYQFYEQMFLFFTVSRVTQPILNQSGPLYYYIPVFIAGLFPWISFFPFSFAYYIKKIQSNEEKFLLVWLFFPFIFFTLVKTKLPNYIFIVYPACAIMLANYFNNFIQTISSPETKNSKALVRAQREILFSIIFYSIMNFCLIIVFIILSNTRFPQEYYQFFPKLYPLGLIMLINALAIFLCYFKFKEKLVYWIFAFTSIIYIVLVLTCPVIEPLKPMKNLAVKLKNIVARGDKVYISMDTHSTNSFVYYLDLKRKISFIKDAKEIDKGERFFYLIGEKDMRKLKKEIGSSLFIIFKHSGNYIISNKVISNF